MATVGSLGNIRFNTSSRRVLTFDNYNRSGQSKVATHEVINQKTNLEFTGLEPEEITFEIQLLAQMNSRPEETVAALRAMRDAGEAVPFLLGGKPVSQNKWILTAVGEAVHNWGKKGAIAYSTVSITVKEYQVTSAETGAVTNGTPWGDISAQVTAVQETIDAYKVQTLDFLDEVDDMGIPTGRFL